MLKEPLVRFGDSGAVPGGDEVQEEAANHGHAEAGVRAGRALIRAGLDESGGDQGDPRLDDPVEEPLGTGTASQCVGVQLEEQTLLRPHLRIAEPLP